jgi:hypothetical protein
MSGPAFVSNRTFDEIPENIDIYELMCRVLNIEPAPNNGSIDRVKQVLRVNDDSTSTTSSMTIVIANFIVYIAVVSLF